MTRERAPCRPAFEQLPSLTAVAGFSLVEGLVALSIVLVIAGAVVRLTDRSQAIFRAQPQVSDTQQRLRVAADVIADSLAMAGAGPYAGPRAGTLNHVFAAVLPRRIGMLVQDAAATSFADRLSILYVPATASQCLVRDQMPDASAPITIDTRPGCPRSHPVCGFEVDQHAVIFDDTGAFDTFRITGVQPATLQIEHGPPNRPLAKAYGPGAVLAEVVQRTYYFDAGRNQLRQYDGYLSDLPVVDHVVGLAFEYFGDPSPPLEPRPPPGTGNCLFDAVGNPLLLPLGPAEGPLVPMTLSQLRDGPFCGLAPNHFDADLYRVRRIRVSVRVQAESRELRGTDRRRFFSPGGSRGGERWVPDYAISLEVAPRNLNLGR